MPRLQALAVQQQEPQLGSYSIQILSRKEDPNKDDWMDNFEVSEVINKN